MNPVKNIRIMCPNLKCRSILVVPETARSKNVKCSNCTTLFKVGQAPACPRRPALKAAAPRAGVGRNGPRCCALRGEEFSSDEKMRLHSMTRGVSLRARCPTLRGFSRLRYFMLS